MLKAFFKDESAATGIEDAIIAGGKLGMLGIPVFLQKWWLNTVGNAMSVREVQSIEGGEVIGSLSYIEHFNKVGHSLWRKSSLDDIGRADPCSEFE